MTPPTTASSQRVNACPGPGDQGGDDDRLHPGLGDQQHAGAEQRRDAHRQHDDHDDLPDARPEEVHEDVADEHADRHADHHLGDPAQPLAERHAERDHRRRPARRTARVAQELRCATHQARAARERRTGR